MKAQNEQALMAYGRTLMGRVAGGTGEADPPWTALYLELLGASPGAAPAAGLRWIFSLVYPQPAGVASYIGPVALTAGDADRWDLMPAAGPRMGTARQLHAEFLEHGGGHETSYFRFFHFMRKYASALPNSYGEDGVSLFEQWKMVAALVGISDDLERPPAVLALVGGDIPGIQRTINTVTSKGAAKAMRGRSAFIQLLGHAVVERLLNELGLGPANVVYDAGGNFVLLAGAAADLARRIDEIATEINEVLLKGTGSGKERFDGFHGDLALALATAPLEVTALRAPAGKAGSPWSDAEGRLKQAVAAAKQRPFADLALGSPQGWNDVFGPEKADSDRFCAVCRRAEAVGESFGELDRDAPESAANTSGLQCPECEGFGALANALGHRGARLLSWATPRSGAAWQRALYAVSARWYAIAKEDERGDVTLALGMDSFPNRGVDGFRLLARTTPMHENGSIKTNEQITERCATAFKRLGVLRMDVDELGALMVEGLPQRTPMQTAELSQALERFFAGRLDRICAQEDGGAGLFYVLFAGGDDLLVIGPWDRMPALALAVYDEFRQYTGKHPKVHLSAGIAVVGEKAPLYAAAGQADEALHEAKKVGRDTATEKDAVSFLGRTLHWEEFGEAVELLEQIKSLMDLPGMPESLLTTLLAVDRRYRYDQASLKPRAGRPAPARAAWGPHKRSDGQTVQALYGPWMWRQAYALGRLKAAHRDAEKDVDALQVALVDGRIEYLGLAARWARWLRRKDGRNGD